MEIAVEPDDFPNGAALTNAVPLITLSIDDLPELTVISFDEFGDPSTGTHFFGLTGPGGTDTNQFDRVVVDALAAIQGGLDVSLIDQGGGIFFPQPTDTFTVLTSDSFFGAFTNVADGTRLETANGLGSFLVEYSAGTNTVVPSDFLATVFTADFDGDGDVDENDLSDWQSAYAINAAGDTDSDGDSDGFDFLTWQQHIPAIFHRQSPRRPSQSPRSWCCCGDW